MTFKNTDTIIHNFRTNFAFIYNLRDYECEAYIPFRENTLLSGSLIQPGDIFELKIWRKKYIEDDEYKWPPILNLESVSYSSIFFSFLKFLQSQKFSYTRISDQIYPVSSFYGKRSKDMGYPCVTYYTSNAIQRENIEAMVAL